MNFAIICDAFPPQRSSAAIHMVDLALFLEQSGHTITVFVTDDSLKNRFSIDYDSNLIILRARVPNMAGISLGKRLFIEVCYPYFLYRTCKRAKINLNKFDGVLWYSPSIFFTLFVSYLKYKSNCKSYLILRDIFPDWAVDLQLISKGLSFYILKGFALFQYHIADRIGVNSPTSKTFIEKYFFLRNKSEVLWTWVGHKDQATEVKNIPIETRVNFIYSGNMGVAQDIFCFGKLAKKLGNTDGINFLFYGRGSDKASFEDFVKSEKLSNLTVNDEVSPERLGEIFLECDVGILGLDIRHTTSNIPGKFLAYMEAGLPVLAKLNPGNDLIDLILDYDVGCVVITDDLDDLELAARDIVEKVKADPLISSRCKQLARQVFSIETARDQIESFFNSENNHKHFK